MFMIPGFIDHNIPRACGTFGATEAEFETKDPMEVAARVKLLKAIRTLEKEIEGEYQRISMRASQALASAPWFKAKTWSEITTKEVYTLVGGRTVVDRLCVHKYLMSQHNRFVAQPANFLASQKFWVRPGAHIDDLELVSAMIARRDPQLDSFTSKARQLIAAFRARQGSSSSNLAASLESDTSFSPEEQSIIRVLHGFVRNTRSTQKDPYVIPVSTIVKRIGLYDTKIEAALVHQLLIELGAVVPWDDPVSRERELFLIPPRDDTLVLPSNPPQSLSTLSPDEFYPSDMVEHVRHDFKDLHAFVIDDAGAQELDDAVSIERIPSEPGRHWVHVHIADPTLKIHPLHTMAQQARLKFQTAYDVHQTLPMIPSTIMYDGLSLGSRSKQGLPENVLTFSAKIDELGEIVDYQVRAGILHNVHVLRYDDVDKLIGQPPVRRRKPFEEPSVEEDIPTPPLALERIDDLCALHTVALRLVVNRFNNDGLWWSMPRGRVTMSPKPPLPNPSDLSHPSIFTGFPYLAYEVEHQHNMDIGARRMVSESMKAACRVASRFFRDRGIPAIRRASSMPTTLTEGGWETLLSQRQPDGYVPITTVLQAALTVPRGGYTLETKGHYALGVPDGEGYVRVTSPLRRYGDLVAHWQIKNALAATGSPSRHLFDDSWLTAFAREVTAKEMGLRQIERRHDHFWTLKFIERWQLAAKSHSDKPNPLDYMEATVTRGPEKDSMFHRPTARVAVLDLGVPAKMEVKDGQTYQLGEQVFVKCKEVRLGTAPELIVSRV